MATIPVFRTWTAGEVVTAAYFNSNVRDAGNFFLATPIAEIRQTVAQSIPNGAWTSLLFDVNDLDTDSAHSTSVNTSRYTGKTAGWFQFGGGYTPGLSNVGERGTRWALNGALVNGSNTFLPTTNATSTGYPGRTKRINLNGSTDYVEFQVYQDSGGANTTLVAVGEAQCSMTVRWEHT